MVQRLQHLYGYDALKCLTSDPAGLNDGSGRSDKRDVDKGFPIPIAMPISIAMAGWSP